VLADVYAGRRMEGVRRGEIRRLLILETLPKPINYSGKMPPISFGGTYMLERILGTVPVEPDGSAYMEVPAMRLPRYLADNLGLVLSNPDFSDVRVRFSRHLFSIYRVPESHLFCLHLLKKYGILPASLSEMTLIDVYATDRAYWRSLWWPVSNDRVVTFNTQSPSVSFSAP
jgi:hypothetical protein